MDCSLENFERMKSVVCPPSPEDVSKLILAGYHDAVAFLGKYFFIICNVLPFSCTRLAFKAKILKVDTKQKVATKFFIFRSLSYDSELFLQYLFDC